MSSLKLSSVQSSTRVSMSFVVSGFVPHTEHIIACMDARGIGFVSVARANNFTSGMFGGFVAQQCSGSGQALLLGSATTSSTGRPVGRQQSRDIAIAIANELVCPSHLRASEPDSCLDSPSWVERPIRFSKRFAGRINSISSWCVKSWLFSVAGWSTETRRLPFVGE